MRDKLIAALLICTVFISSVQISVFASENTENSTVNSEVTAQKDSSFRITVPDGLQADITEDEYGYTDYTIKVAADIASDEHLLVYPEDAYTSADGDESNDINFLLSSGDKTIIADINQSSTEVTCADTLNGMEKMLYGNIKTKEKLRAGSWKGKFPIKVEFGKAYEPITLSSENYSAIGYSTETTNLVIPETMELDGKIYVITEIASGTFASATNLQTVEMADSIKTINVAAFNNAYNIKSVKFSKNLEEIKAIAFNNCRNLTSIEVNSAIIGAQSFTGCTSLTEATLSNITSIQSNIFSGCNNLETLSINGGNNEGNCIGGTAFISLPALSKLTINKIDKIDTNAFANCTKIDSIVFDKYLTTLNNLTFSDCTSLANVDFGEECNIKVASATDFQGTPWLTAQLAEKDIVCTPSGILLGTNDLLGDIVIPAEVKAVNNELDFTNVTSIAFEKGSQCKEIGSYAFYNCEKLSSIKLPEGLETIGNSAFSFCSALENIEIPDTVKTIGKHAFSHTENVQNTTINIPASVENLGVEYPTHMFYNTGKDNTFVAFTVDSANTHYKAVDGILYSKDGKQLISIPRGKTFTDNTYEIPEGITYLAELSFSRNYNIDTIVLPDSYTIYNELPSEWGFLNHGNSVSSAIYQFTNVKAYEVKASNSKYKSVDSCIYSKDGTTLIAVPVEYEGTLSIPEGVTTIAENAFDSTLSTTETYTNITNISIPSTLTTMDDITLDFLNSKATAIESNRKWIINSLSDTYKVMVSGKLTTEDITSGLVIQNNILTDGTSVAGDVVIPATVTAIANDAFNGNSSITSISFESGSVCSSIGDYAFQDCTNITSLILPSSLRTLGLASFKYCNSLRVVDVPEGVTTIKQDAFNMSGTGIADLILPTTLTSIGNWAFANNYNMLVHYRGSAEQWENITYSASDNEPLDNATKDYDYSD